MVIEPEISQKIYASICEIPQAQKLLDILSESKQFGVAIFGGALRDLLSNESVGHDLDILIYGEKRDGFTAYVKEAAARLAAETFDYPGSHIVVKLPATTVTFDVHYPKYSYLEGLVRSDFTVNGIGYVWKEKQLDDPLGGVADLRNRKLVIHSPQYIVTDAPTFPRMFRTAAKLQCSIEGEAEQIIRRFAPLVSLHSGKTNVRTLLEFLKFLSLEKIAPFLRQMNQLHLLEGLFPELAVPSTVMLSPKHSVLSRNVELACALDEIEASGQLWEFLRSPFLLGINYLSLIRFMSLFYEIGAAYEAFKPDAPYVKAMTDAHTLRFVDRMEKNLISHAASRYQEAPEICRFLLDLPQIFRSLRKPEEPLPQLSPASNACMQVFQSLLRTLSQKK